MDDKNNSYSIYIEKRPFRVVYLLYKKSVTFELIDNIIEYNIDRWGGRYNYILLVNKTGPNEEQWKFLESFDPDVVKSNIPVTKKLALDLNTKVTPLLVLDGSREPNFSPHIDNEGLSILPTPKNIATVADAFGDSYLVLFDTSQCTDQNIKDFINRNFGTLDLRNAQNLNLNTYPNKKVINITDKQSLIDALSSFNDFKPYVFPIQLCSIGDFIDFNGKGDDQNLFYVFVGDNPQNLLDFWHNPNRLTYWSRTKLRQLWIPENFINDHGIVPALQKLILGRADAYGNGQRRVIYLGSGYAKAKLEKIASTLTTNYLIKGTGTLKNNPYPESDDFFSFSRLKGDMQHIRASGKEEKIIIPSPEIEEGSMGGQYWMNDFYIQIPERKVLPANFETWLQLPRNNAVAHTVIPHGPTRITKNGLPSIMISRAHRLDPDTQAIDTQLPKTYEIFASIILNTAVPIYRSDARTPYIKPYKYEIRTSSAGRHLHGFLEVFGSLSNTYSILREGHWRKFLELLANSDQDTEIKRLQQIKTVLSKKVNQLVNDTSNFTKDRFTEWLTNEVFKFSKQFTDSAPKAKPFTALEKIVKEELSEYNSKHPNSKFKYHQKSVIEELKYLTDSEIIQIGYEPICPSCLNREWRSLNELNQRLICRGCGQEYFFPPEANLRYKLNSLIENGIRTRGILPVVLSLGQLFGDASNYFDFLSSVNIYKKDKLITDLDICCISDGKFIIGEIKVRQEAFGPNDFKKIADLAKEIHADRIVYGSMDEKPSQHTLDQVQKINTEVQKFGITAEWLQLDPWIFEASLIQ